MALDVSGAGTALETGGGASPPETMQWERGRRLTYGFEYGTQALLEVSDSKPSSMGQGQQRVAGFGAWHGGNHLDERSDGIQGRPGQGGDWDDRGMAPVLESFGPFEVYQ